MSYEIVQRRASALPPVEAVCEPGCGCEATAASLATASDGFRRAVWIVLILNAAMFAVATAIAQVWRNWTPAWSSQPPCATANWMISIG